MMRTPSGAQARATRVVARQRSAIAFFAACGDRPDFGTATSLMLPHVMALVASFLSHRQG